jgi:hypothetical protein
MRNASRVLKAQAMRYATNDSATQSSCVLSRTFREAGSGMGEFSAYWGGTPIYSPAPQELNRYSSENYAKGCTLLRLDYLAKLARAACKLMNTICLPNFSRLELWP